MEKVKHLLLENKAWAQGRVDVDSHFFENMAKDQSPEFLWIGCSDSRVPESEITGSTPGQIFVHRNIANLVVHTDTNFLSVLNYAVDVLKVPHIIVCGHYNCGGVRAALSHSSMGLMDNWIRNIKDVYFTHREQMNNLKTDEERVNRLVEYNVLEQVRNLAHTSIIQRSWHERRVPHIHGWVYDLHSGLLKDLLVLEPGSPIEPAYQFKF
jgi:carbonic anhydrase